MNMIDCRLSLKETHKRCINPSLLITKSQQNFYAGEFWYFLRFRWVKNFIKFVEILLFIVYFDSVKKGIKYGAESL